MSSYLVSSVKRTAEDDGSEINIEKTEIQTRIRDGIRRGGAAARFGAKFHVHGHFMEQFEGDRSAFFTFFDLKSHTFFDIKNFTFYDLKNATFFDLRNATIYLKNVTVSAPIKWR